MRIPMPINTPPNPFSSNGARPSIRPPDLNPANVARAGALDAAAANSGLATAPSAFDAGSTAKNILDVVKSQLLQAQANGASPAQLARLLQQARDGAQSGFDSAISQLKDIGELTDSLNSGISNALQQVDKGLADLAKQLGIGGEAQAGGGSAAAPSLGDLASGYGEQFAANQSVDMTIKTADGDTVHLKIGTGGAVGADGSVQGRGGVTVSVDGNLDADETKALNDLVGKVGKIADSFFSGDMDSATQQADALQLDNPELGSLSLTLRSGGIPANTGAAAYQGVQSLGSGALADYAASSAADASGGASEVKSQLAQQLSALIPDASFSDNPAATLKQLLAAQVAAKDQQGSPLLDFANRLLDAMGANRGGTAQGS